MKTFPKREGFHRLSYVDWDSEIKNLFTRTFNNDKYWLFKNNTFAMIGNSKFFLKCLWNVFIDFLYRFVRKKYLQGVKSKGRNAEINWFEVDWVDDAEEFCLSNNLHFFLYFHLSLLQIFCSYSLVIFFWSLSFLFPFFFFLFISLLPFPPSNFPLP